MVKITLHKIVEELVDTNSVRKIKSKTREFNLNVDRKRFWLGKLENIDHKVSNESVPLSMNFLAKKLNTELSVIKCVYKIQLKFYFFQNF